MPFYENGGNDLISILRDNILDLESENERLQKKAASYTKSVKRDNKIVYEIDPKYETQAREIAEKITANTLRVTKMKGHLDEIDKMFKTFPNGLRTWEDLIGQKQYLERKIRNPEQFVCYIDWSDKEKTAKLEAEREQKQAEILAKLTVVDECIKKIRPLLFESTSN
jgi:hypothetical protein